MLFAAPSTVPFNGNRYVVAIEYISKHTMSFGVCIVTGSTNVRTFLMMSTWIKLFSKLSCWTCPFSIRSGLRFVTGSLPQFVTVQKMAEVLVCICNKTFEVWKVTMHILLVCLYVLNVILASPTVSSTLGSPDKSIVNHLETKHIVPGLKHSAWAACIQKLSKARFSCPDLGEILSELDYSLYTTVSQVLYRI